MRIICVNTGNKFSEWYVDNLKHMIDNFSCLQYEEFVVIRDDEYGGVYNKLLMFDKYRDGQNIYFDLDIIITGDCNNFLRKDFTLCNAWWRKKFHTPLNSSIMSWQGDQSHIHKMFDKDPEYFMLKYWKGIDQYIYENFKYIEYGLEDNYCSYQTIQPVLKSAIKDYNVYLFNQNYKVLTDPEFQSSLLGQFLLQYPPQ